MPLPVAAASALFKGGSALAKYGASRYNIRKRGTFGETSEARDLARRRREGDLSPQEERNILGSQNRALSAVSEAETARTEGRLASRGLSGSIAGVRALSQPNVRRMAELGQTSRDIAASEATAKSRYGTEFAAKETAFGRETEALKSGARSELVGGLGGALGGYLQSKVDKEAGELEHKRKLELAKPDRLKIMESIQAGGGFQEGSLGGGTPEAPLQTGAGYTPPQSGVTTESAAKTEIENLFGNMDKYNEWYDSLEGTKPRGWIEALSIVTGQKFKRG